VREARAHRLAYYRRSDAGNEWLGIDRASEAATADLARNRDLGTCRSARWRPFGSQAIHPPGLGPHDGAHYRTVLIGISCDPMMPPSAANAAPIAKASV